MDLHNENNIEIPQFLINMLKEQYETKTVKQILEGYTKDRRVTFRVNTLKSNVEIIQNILEKAGIEYENVIWSKEAFIIENKNETKLRELDIYKKGEIYLQSLSSMLPPIVLNPKQGNDILDMTAAPGGKTTQMAAMAENKAHITACEMNTIRTERLKYNIEKQGASCVYIMNKDARQIDDFFSFDQILLDAPCSGSGTLNSNNQNIDKIFTMKLINKSTKTQLELLKKAIKILKPGREMVYSTCSILQCENEDIIQKALIGTNAEVVPIQFKGMEDLALLPVKINGCLCVCPDKNFEGFFVAKIKKNKK